MSSETPSGAFVFVWEFLGVVGFFLDVGRLSIFLVSKWSVRRKREPSGVF